jgi:lysozyme family protein
MDFDAAFDRLVSPAVEGGYVNDPLDPGGATRYGVTQAVARAHGYTGDMRDYPLEDAKAVYRACYWDPCHCDDLPPEVRYGVFDAAVNSGTHAAVAWLQRAAGVLADGTIGPVTLAAVRASPAAVAAALCGVRLAFMTDLADWPHDGRGWAKRVAGILQLATPQK